MIREHRSRGPGLCCSASRLSPIVLLLVASWLALPASAQAGTVHDVPAEYATIQEAIDAASDGDTVRVAPGAYAGAGNRGLVFGGKALVVEGGPDGDAVIRCDGLARGVTIGPEDEITLRHLVVVEGTALEGAGVLVVGSAPVIEHCSFIRCGAAYSGGAVAAIAGASPELTGSAASGCSAGRRGGALFVDELSGAEIDSCRFSFNVTDLASTGGAIWVGGPGGPGRIAPKGSRVRATGDAPSVRISRSSFTNNECAGWGGAVGSEHPGTLELVACDFSANWGQGGGGAVFATSAVALSLEDCRLTGNAARGDGGAVRLEAGATATITGSTIAGNRSEGSGGGVSVENGTVQLDRVVLRDNGAWDAAPDVHAELPAAFVSITRSLVDPEGGGGDGTIGANDVLHEGPLFCDPRCFEHAPSGKGVYTVDESSPCLAANNAWNVRVGSEEAGCPYVYASSGVELLSRIGISELPCENQRGATDVWGYTSPAGREYAILGLERGLLIADVTEPTAPEVITIVDSAPSATSDMKTYGEYLYNVTGSGAGVGLQIVDLSRVDEKIVTELTPFSTQGFSRAHNLALDETSGFAYLCLLDAYGGAFAAVDLADPEKPAFAGSWGSAAAGDGVHDAQVVTYTEGPHAGRQIAYAAAEDDGLLVIDVTNKAAMTVIAQVIYPSTVYAHQCWLGEDRRYLFLGDELDEIYHRIPTTTHVFDVENPDEPAYVGSFTNGSSATDHNLMVRGSFAYEANYLSGLRVFDVADIEAVSEVAWFDTHPESDRPTFEGAWGVYAMLPSGTVLVSDRERGLYAFDVLDDGTPVEEVPEVSLPGAPAPDQVALHPGSPNPFNPFTTIRYDVPVTSPVSCAIYSLDGRRLRVLVEAATHPAGRFAARWDGRDGAGRRVASGVYFVRLEAGGVVARRSLVLVE